MFEPMNTTMKCPQLITYSNLSDSLYLNIPVIIKYGQYSKHINVYFGCFLVSKITQNLWCHMVLSL